MMMCFVIRKLLMIQSKKRRHRNQKQKSRQLTQTGLTYDNNNTDFTLHLSRICAHFVHKALHKVSKNIWGFSL